MPGRRQTYELITPGYLVNHKPETLKDQILEGEPELLVLVDKVFIFNSENSTTLLSPISGSSLTGGRTACAV